MKTLKLIVQCANYQKIVFVKFNLNIRNEIKAKLMWFSYKNTHISAAIYPSLLTMFTN